MDVTICDILFQSFLGIEDLGKIRYSLLIRKIHKNAFTKIINCFKGFFRL